VGALASARSLIYIHWDTLRTIDHEGPPHLPTTRGEPCGCRREFSPLGSAGRGGALYRARRAAGSTPPPWVASRAGGRFPKENSENDRAPPRTPRLRNS